MEQSPKHLTKLFGQIVKALSFSSSETEKTETDTNKTPDSVQTAEEALEHDFPSSTCLSSQLEDNSSSSPIRLLIIRSIDGKEKILFDSHYVTENGQYLPQKDAKFLKDIVLTFAFGSMPLKKPETIRFTRVDHEKCAFSIVFNLSTTSSSTTHSPRKPPPFQDSSTDSSSSSSGYCSLPILDDQSSDYSSSSLNPSHSLPATPCHFLRGTAGCRNSSRITMSAVLLFSNIVTPPLLEPLLFPLQTFISQSYIRSRSKFSTELKSYFNCLNLDVHNFCNLSQHQLPPALDSNVLSLFKLNIFAEFIALLITNPCSKIAVIASSKITNSALALFKICYLVKNFKSYFPPSPEKLSNNNNNKMIVPELDSGFFSCTNIKSNICDEEEELICDSGTSVEEKSHNKFYLGDEEDDEQTEAKLGLSEPMKEKLFPNQNPSHNNTKPILNIKQIPLEIDSTTKMVQQQNKPEHYYLNSSSRFSPFQTYQLFNSSPNYDYIHQRTNEILEVNLEKPLLRAINVKVEPSQHSKEEIRSWLLKTREMTKYITDPEKTLLFFLVNIINLENVK